MASVDVLDRPVRAAGVSTTAGMSADRLVVAFLVVSCAFLIAPLWITALPPMSDFPANAAILFIQTHSQPGAAISKYYGVAWSPVPNLGSELIVPVLARVLPLIAALKLFLSVGVALWVIGPAAVQYALLRRLHVTALIAPLFAYNRAFFVGLMNFYFAAGFGFFFIALWIASERLHPAVRTPAAMAMFTVLYFLHAMAAIFIFPFLLIYEVARSQSVDSRVRHTLVLFAAALPALLCYCWFVPSHHLHGPIVFDLVDSFAERVASVSWSWFGPVAFVLLTATAVALALRYARLDPRMTVPLAVLAAACLVLPAFAGGAWGSHIRYPAIGVMLLFAALSTNLGPGAWRYALPAAVLAAEINALLLCLYWHEPDLQTTAVREALDSLPLGAKTILAADDETVRNGGTMLSRMRHVGEYATIDRSAFVPIAFARPDQHIVFVRPAYRSRAAGTSDQSGIASTSELEALAHRGSASPGIVASFPYLVSWPCFFDSLMLLRVTHRPAPQLDGLHVMREEPFFTLYAIDRPSWCSARD